MPAAEPVVLNGKKMSFREHQRGSLKVRIEDGNRSFRDTSRQLHEEGDARSPVEPAERGGEEPEEAEEVVEASPEEGKAPKFSTVLKNFRPPSLAKFVPKSKSSINTAGCDV